MSIKELRDFMYENFFSLIGFSKENLLFNKRSEKYLLLFATKLIEK